MTRWTNQKLARALQAPLGDLVNPVLHARHAARCADVFDILDLVFDAGEGHQLLASNIGLRHLLGVARFTMLQQLAGEYARSAA